MRTADWSDSVSVLDRVCALLDALDDDPDASTGVSEIARRANLPKSTVSRLVGELASHRLVERDGSGVFLGARMYELAQGVDAPRRLRRTSQPVLSDLRDLTGAGVALAVPHRGAALVIATARSARSAVAAPTEGSVVPAHSTALGRALHEDDTASCGIHVERGEHRPGVDAVATLVRSADGSPLAALAVYGAPAPLDADHLITALRVAARTLGKRLAAASDADGARA